MAVDPESIRPEEFMDPDCDDEDDDDYDPNEDLNKTFDLLHDGKLLKTITKCGVGTATPGPTAEVRLHYTGKLEDGTQFATSHSTSSPATVHLGQGHVIRGWEEALRTMKKGEQATLQCAPEYGYGEAGKPPSVPPGAPLTFEVELVSWAEWKDISEKKDGSMMKKTTTEGEGWKTPDFDTVVTFSWTLKLRDEPKTLASAERQTATIGAEEIRPRGLEKALQTMMRGEKALLLLLPAEGFGPSGVPEWEVLGDAELMYEVQLDDFQAVLQPWEVEAPEEKLTRAQQLKAEGNDLFRAGHVSRAVKKYQFAFAFVESDFATTAAQRAERRSLRASIHLNLAACALRSGVWDSVVEHCSHALDCDPGNGKALLRRGKAYTELAMWREGRLDLQAVLDGEGAGEKAEAQKELTRLNRLAKAQDQKEMKAFRSLFDSTATNPVNTAAEGTPTSD